MKTLEEILKEYLDFDKVVRQEVVQELWSGYGELIRVYLEGYVSESVIVKKLSEPKISEHPRGWNSAFAHQRKLKSYKVERNWYKYYSYQMRGICPMATFYAVHEDGEHTYLILEDLKNQGYTIEKEVLDLSEVKSILTWLAYFHANFMKDEPLDLWEEGTYWHLATRPDEYEAIGDERLMHNASHFDHLLKDSRFQTLVHGDAKYANFLFNEEGTVAGVDFQYVGGGCGMKDVVYLLSCYGDEMNEFIEEECLTHYFTELKKACKACYYDFDLNELEQNWRALYSIAWADFVRFLDGWSPGHWKISYYAQQQVDKALFVE